MDNFIPKEIESKLLLRKNELIDAANTMTVESEQDAESAADVIKCIKSLINKSESERKNIVSPFNEGVKNINNRFKEITTPLKQSESYLKDKVLQYKKKIIEEARIAYEKDVKKKSEELFENSNEEEALQVIDSEVKIFKKTENALNTSRGYYGGSVSISKRWDFEVTDITALAKDNPDLVMPVSSRIRSRIKEGDREIKGLRIYQKEIAVAR